jgi:hypothetical protein
MSRPDAGFVNSLPFTLHNDAELVDMAMTALLDDVDEAALLFRKIFPTTLFVWSVLRART